MHIVVKYYMKCSSFSSRSKIWRYLWLGLQNLHWQIEFNVFCLQVETLFGLVTCKVHCSYLYSGRSNEFVILLYWVRTQAMQRNTNVSSYYIVTWPLLISTYERKAPLIFNISYKCDWLITSRHNQWSWKQFYFNRFSACFSERLDKSMWLETVMATCWPAGIIPSSRRQYVQWFTMPPSKCQEQASAGYSQTTRGHRYRGSRQTDGRTAVSPLITSRMQTKRRLFTEHRLLALHSLQIFVHRFESIIIVIPSSATM